MKGLNRISEIYMEYGVGAPHTFEVRMLAAWVDERIDVTGPCLEPRAGVTLEHMQSVVTKVAS